MRNPSTLKTCWGTCRLPSHSCAKLDTAAGLLKLRRRGCPNFVGMRPCREVEVVETQGFIARVVLKKSC